MAKIELISEKCTGCRLCEAVCSSRQSDFNPAKSSIFVEFSLPQSSTIRPYVCIHCEEHPCVDACPVSAIVEDEALGIFVVNKDLCNGCGVCIPACPYTGLRLDPTKETVLKCNLCLGNPQCVQICPTKVIQLTEKV